MKFVSIYNLIYFFVLINFSCKNNAKYDDESTWLLQNEKLMNKELEKRILEDLNTVGNDTSWFEKSIVVTKYDTTILGEFAKRIDAISECYEIEYTYSKGFNKKKIITIINDKSNYCIGLQKKDFLKVDSSKFFKIRP